MKKNIFKKIFIKISKILGYEIIDQNEFYSPTLEKNINENLSNLKKSKIELNRKSLAHITVHDPKGFD